MGASKNISIIWILILTSIFGLQGCLTVYPAIDTNNAYQAINELKDDGTLIIFMESSERKLEELKKLSESATLSNNKLIRINDVYTEELNARNDRVKNMILAFDKHYDFSNVRFSYDYALQELKDGATTIVEVSIDAELSKMELPDNVYFAKYNLFSGAKYSKTWHFLDKNHNKLKAPFPVIKKEYPIWLSIMYLFKRSIDNPYELSAWTNHKFNKLYEMANRNNR